MTVCLFIVPFVMVLCGFFMYKFPPEEPNAFVGYRTKRSTTNADTWLFANRYCGKLWMKLGILLAALSVLAAVVVIATGETADETVYLVAEIVELAVLLGSVLPVEITLKRTFDENGRRKK